MMINFSEKDFKYAPLPEFLQDRFEGEISASKINEIKALSLDWAEQIHLAHMKLLRPYEINQPKIKKIEKIKTDIDSKIVITNWLVQQMKDVSDQNIIASWDKEIAVLVPKNTFIEYWDDFCYPSSDDVSITPLGGSWMLYYFHEQEFQFGMLD